MKTPIKALPCTFSSSTLAPPSFRGGLWHLLLLEIWIISSLQDRHSLVYMSYVPTYLKHARHVFLNGSTNRTNGVMMLLLNTPPISFSVCTLHPAYLLIANPTNYTASRLGIFISVSGLIGYLLFIIKMCIDSGLASSGNVGIFVGNRYI